MTSKHKRSDTGNSYLPEESCGMLSLREKIEVVDSIKGKKTPHKLRLLRSTIRTNILHHEIVKEKETHSFFAVVPQATKFTATVHKCSVKIVKATNLYVENF